MRATSPRAAAAANAAVAAVSGNTRRGKSTRHLPSLITQQQQHTRSLQRLDSVLLQQRLPSRLHQIRPQHWHVMKR